jgi:hypothetical protein
VGTMVSVVMVDTAAIAATAIKGGNMHRDRLKRSRRDHGLFCRVRRYRDTRKLINT